MKVPVRYKMNMGVLNYQNLMKLQQTEVIIVGLGGLGGNVANQLVRLGVKHMALVDFDSFSESNLNRQLFSNTENVGECKVDVISNELNRIDPDATIRVIKKRIQDVDHVVGDYLIDCVDNKETKIYLSKLSNQLGIPLLHGSCGGWYGQVGWISPQCTLLEELYGDGEKGLEADLLNPPYVVNVVASYMVSEFTKMIISSSKVVLDELLMIDLFDNNLIKSGGKSHG
jgi:molybdopterin/thiamine biosynthesis adenylyltransferase